MSRGRRAGLPVSMRNELAEIVRAELASAMSVVKSSPPPAAIAGGDPTFWLPDRMRRTLTGGNMDRPLEQHAWISAGVRFVAENFVRAILRFWRGTKEKHERAVKSTDPCVMVWDKPNSYMDSGYFAEAIITHIWDIGYVGIVKQRKGGQRLARAGDIPEELWPIRGSFLEPEFEDGPASPPTGWRLRNAAGLVTFAPWEVLWVRTFNPYDPWKGLGRIQAAMAAANQDYKSEQFMTGFIENEATPGGVFSVDFHTLPEERQALADNYEARHMGPSNVNRIMVLRKGVSFTPTTYSPRDMQYRELGDWNMHKTCAVIGVQPVLLGFTDTSNRATASASKDFFLRNTMMPAADKVARAITMDMQQTWVGCQDVWAEYDWSHLPELQEIQGETVVSAKTFFDMGMPLNRIIERMKLGFQPTETGDIGFMPSSYVPSEVLADLEEMPGAAAPAPAPAEQPAEGDQAEGEDPGANGTAEDEADAEQEQANAEEGKANAALRVERAAMMPKWLLYVARVLDPIERALAKKVRRLFWDLRRHLLDLVDDAFVAVQNPARALIQRAEEKQKRRLSRSLIDRLLFNEKEWGDRLTEIIAPAHKDAARRSLEFVKDELPKGTAVMDVGDPKVARFLAEKDIEVQDIASGMREELRETLVDSVIEADTIAEAQVEVAKIMRAKGGNFLARSLTIARTETAMAANGARHMELEEQAAQPGSKITSHRWVTADDDHVRLSHRRLHGDVVEIGKPFDNGLTYPGQPGAPPGEVINCRCVAVPVIDR